MTRCFTLALLAAASLCAQAPALEQLLASSRMPIAIENGRLSGAGAGVMRDAMKNARFVLIGEDHGIAEIPAFSAALYAELVPAGFNNLIVEVGPEAGRRLNRVLAAGDAETELTKWLRQYPFSLAFYNLRQEFDFLRAARKASGSSFRVIGVDQELMGAGRMLLEAVSAKDSRLPALLAEEKKAAENATRTGNPMDLFMLAGNADDLNALRGRLRGTDAAQVQALLDSREIYARLPRSQYESNQMRGSLMKRYYEAQTPRDRAGVPAKAVLKFGAYHVAKGLNPLNSRELGNHVAEIADGLGESSVHILIVAAKGNQRRFGGVGKPFIAAPVDQVGPGQSDFPYAKALFEKAIAEQGWSVFDFRQMRDWADRQRNLDPRLVRMILGFDFAVIIPEGTPSDEIR